LGRRKAVDFFLRFQGKARMICGRCESSWALTIWTAADVRRYLKTVSPFDNDEVIQRAYRAFVFRCPICGHEAHLAETGGTASWVIGTLGDEAAGNGNGLVDSAFCDHPSPSPAITRMN